MINTLFMNLMERGEEISVLRGVLKTRPEISKMILAETGKLGEIDGGLGLACGLFLTWILPISLLGLMGYDVRFVLPVRGIFLGFLISLNVSQIAAIFPSWREAGLNVGEAIQYE
ncbi:FtsX-like permease family protein [Chloroflexota bacterium]